MPKDLRHSSLHCTTEHAQNSLPSNQGHTCSVVRRTKLLVAQYLLPQKTDRIGVVLVACDLDGSSDEDGPFSQRYLSYNGKTYGRTNSLVQWTTEQVRPCRGLNCGSVAGYRLVSAVLKNQTNVEQGTICMCRACAQITLSLNNAS